MLCRIALLLSIAGSIAAQQPSAQGRRLALVVANAGYQKLPGLSTAATDAELMTAALKRAGFAVTQAEMRFTDFKKAYEQPFLNNIQPGDTVVFYYAGYAVQVADDDSYLLPVDFEPMSPQDMEDRSYRLGRMFDGLEMSKAGLKIVIVEAGTAIDSPVPGTSPGLMAPERVSKDTLVAYSTSPGQTIPKATARSDSFTQTLAGKLAQPGLRILDVFRDTRREIAASPGGGQVPFLQDDVVQNDFEFTPELTVTPSLLTFRSPRWNEKPGAQTLRIYADGRSIGFTAVVPPADKWLSVTPTGGMTPAVDAPNVTVSVDPAGLAPGATYASEIAITAAGLDGTAPPKMAIVSYTVPPKPPPPALVPHPNRRDREEYILIPSGDFQMGCVPADERCKRDETPRHPVKITKAFWMGRNEVEVNSWRRYIESNGLKKMPPWPLWPNSHEGDLPIVNVSWENARDYCAWAGGRLPTEAEWEYAARAGVDDEVYPLNDENGRDKANFFGKHGNDTWEYTAPVRRFDANRFGLYDMAGNVWEWVSDFYAPDYYAHSPEADPRGPAEGKQHVRRGGSFDSDPSQHLRISLREEFEKAVNNVGFRCVLDDTSETHKLLDLQ
jgi:formylglycine-generating enzyme required for sulfatase activity